MPQIQLLDEKTIDRIAAGEVIERPSSVVKELVENAVDAKATAITVEIKDGGISLIRITDNGQGIPKDQVPKAFLRHATSKLQNIEDLLTISSLGFRGEALSSIASVAQVELITKTAKELSGTKYVIEGSKEISLEEVGTLEGTTFFVRNLFYNTPARRKFLKSAQTEASYISTLVERLALSHPDISFQLIINHQPKLHTNGNAKIKDIIYHIFGRDIASGVLPIQAECSLFSVHGFVGKPFIARGNRNYEIYFINGRYIKSTLITKCIEEAYHPFLMKHQYPFVVLQIVIDSEQIDVNVHPAKMEIRFQQNELIYTELTKIIREALEHKDMIPEVPLSEEKKKTEGKPLERRPEPFETKRLEAIAEYVKKDSPYERKYTQKPFETKTADTETEPLSIAEDDDTYHIDFIQEAKLRNYTIIGQLFQTYWLVQVENELFIIDQHAAHEKVLYEKMMHQLENHDFTSQQISPPVVISMTIQEQELFEAYQEQFIKIGFEINPFGGREYAICAVPANLYNLDQTKLFLEMLDGLSHHTGKKTPDIILEKIASMSCKAAVKGRQHLSRAEAEQLIFDLLKLENPYHCPHGRPTIIAMSKTEIEKKFKRIV